MAAETPKDPSSPAEEAAITKEATPDGPAEDTAIAGSEVAAPAPKAEVGPEELQAEAPKKEPIVLSDVLDPAVAAALGRSIELDADARTETEGDDAKPASAPAEPVSPTKEWGAALGLMVLFAAICGGFLIYLRNC